MEVSERPYSAIHSAAFISGAVRTHALQWEFGETTGLLRYSLKADYMLPTHAGLLMTDFCKENFGVSEIGTLDRRWSFHPGLSQFTFRFEADRMFFMLAWSGHNVII